MAETVIEEGKLFNEIIKILNPLPFVPTLHTLVAYIQGLLKEAYDEGYSEGLSEGYDDGYENGRDDGQA
jgi:hypothetical protein